MNWYYLTLSITEAEHYLFFQNAESAERSHIKKSILSNAITLSCNTLEGMKL